jgi:hypothetical protein
VNESQSKFLTGTWSISENRPDVSLFYLGQDRLAIDKLSALGTRLGTATKTQINASRTSCEIDDKNRIKELSISSQSFNRTIGGRVRKNTAGEQFEPRILKSFDPVTRELYRLLPTTIHTKADDSKSKFGGKHIGWNSALEIRPTHLEASHTSRKKRNPTA